MTVLRNMCTVCFGRTILLASVSTFSPAEYEPFLVLAQYLAERGDATDKIYFSSSTVCTSRCR